MKRKGPGPGVKVEFDIKALRYREAKTGAVSGRMSWSSTATRHS